MVRKAGIIALAMLGFAAVLLLPDRVPSGPTFRFDVAGSLSAGRMLAALALVYVSGLGTSLTPCVYPLIPITLSVMGVKKDGSRLSNLGLASAYVAGMVVTYDGVGIVLMLSHKAFGSLLGNPWVISPIALLFVILAMPMFGVLEIGLPPAMQERLNRVGGAGLVGSFLMGLVAGIVAAPCSGPVTALIAGVVTRTGNVGLGTAFMTVYAVGIGTLFFALAAFSVRLPKSGPWMEGIKSAFGIALVTLALLYLKDAFPAARAGMDALSRTLRSIAPIAAGVTAAGILFGALHRSFHGSGTEKALKLAGVAMVVAGIFLRLGVSAPGAEEPRSGIAQGAAASRARTAPEISFVGLDEGLKRARAEHMPVFIDFGAEWCAACRELERKTYPDPRVRAEASRFVAVKIDGTNETDALDALYQTYGVLGLPTVVFLDSSGKAVDALKLTGFEPPARFLARMQKIR